jgi:hypothetical protein
MSGVGPVTFADPTARRQLIEELNGGVPEMGILYQVELQEITDPEEIPEEVNR